MRRRKLTKEEVEKVYRKLSGEFKCAGCGNWFKIKSASNIDGKLYCPLCSYSVLIPQIISQELIRSAKLRQTLRKCLEEEET